MVLSEVGILISSILLSLGGCIAVSATELRKSRCTSIKSQCCACVRDVPPMEEGEVS
jgi:hypothetical protein